MMKALQRCSVAVPKTLLPNLQESSILYYIYKYIYNNNIGIFLVWGKGNFVTATLQHCNTSWHEMLKTEMHKRAKMCKNDGLRVYKMTFVTA